MNTKKSENSSAIGLEIVQKAVKPTFENLPELISNLITEVFEIKRLVVERRDVKPEPDELLTVQTAAKFLSLSVPTVYSLISKGDLPVMKRSKRCYFSKIELIEYLKSGRNKTNSEVEAEAQHFLNRKKART